MRLKWDAAPATYSHAALFCSTFLRKAGQFKAHAAHRTGWPAQTTRKKDKLATSCPARDTDPPSGLVASSCVDDEGTLMRFSPVTVPLKFWFIPDLVLPVYYHKKGYLSFNIRHHTALKVYSADHVQIMSVLRSLIKQHSTLLRHALHLAPVAQLASGAATPEKGATRPCLGPTQRHTPEP